jgi:hypothetical protein
MEEVAPSPEGVRLCVSCPDGSVRKVARLNWSKTDSSLYIKPYCPKGGRSYAGRVQVPPSDQSATFSFEGQLEGGAVMPKMSLHQSGLTRTELNGRGTMFVESKPWPESSGGHVATIKTFDPYLLPLMDKSNRRTPDVIAVDAKEPWTSIRYLINVHTEEVGGQPRRAGIGNSAEHGPYGGALQHTRPPPRLNRANGATPLGASSAGTDWSRAVRKETVSDDDRRVSLSPRILVDIPQRPRTIKDKHHRKSLEHSFPSHVRWPNLSQPPTEGARSERGIWVQ